MLLDVNLVKKALSGKEVRGVLHIGAHECEELPFYLNDLKVDMQKIYWIEAIPYIVDRAQKKNILNVFQAIITDKDDDVITFNVSNNIQSSSVLDFGTHAIEHPQVHFTNKFKGKTTTIDTFLKRHTIDASTINFWNLDIQGAELMALKGAPESMKYADFLYLEVNEKELYKGCGMIHELDVFLQEKGFRRELTNMTEHGWGDALYVRSI